MTPSSFLETNFKILSRASVDRKSDARNVVVSIFDKDYPTSRIMILRGLDFDNKSFTFFTDSESEKCELLKVNSAGSLLVWDKKNRCQIRVLGKFIFEPDVDKYWDNLGDAGKESYGNCPVPLTPILDKSQFKNVPTMSRFTVLKFYANKMDILWLKKERHIRAVYHINDNWQGTWVVP